MGSGAKHRRRPSPVYRRQRGGTRAHLRFLESWLRYCKKWQWLGWLYGAYTVVQVTIINDRTGLPRRLRASHKRNVVGVYLPILAISHRSNLKASVHYCQRVDAHASV